MIFRKTQHQKKMLVKSFDSVSKELKSAIDSKTPFKIGEIKIETHLVTTYWFLFIPVYSKKEFLQSSHLNA